MLIFSKSYYNVWAINGSLYTWLLQSGYNLWQLQNFIVDHYSDILLAFDVKINWNATALRKFNIIFTRTAWRYSTVPWVFSSAFIFGSTNIFCIVRFWYLYDWPSTSQNFTIIKASVQNILKFTKVSHINVGQWATVGLF